MVPTKSWKYVSLPGVYVNVVLVPDSLLPTAGALIAAGAGGEAAYSNAPMEGVLGLR